MDMNLRDWLILIGVVFIALVFIGGFFRMRLDKKRKNELHFGLEEVKGDAGDYFGELPSGGARKAGTKSERLEPEVSPVSFEEDSKPEVQAESSEHFLQEKATVAELREGEEFKTEGRQESISEDLEEPQVSVQRKMKVEGSFRIRDVEPEVIQLDVEDKKETNHLMQTDADKLVAAEVKGEATEKLSERASAKELIVVNVVAKGGQPFEGARLLESLLGAGMYFGDMSIFHRYDSDTGKILFSVANGVEPGIFNIDDIDSTSTPVVSFFMGLPGPSEPVKAFSLMIETAKQFALDLGGELKDEQFSVMTQQTIEHSRQRIIDYERKQLAQRVSG